MDEEGQSPATALPPRQGQVVVDATESSGTSTSSSSAAQGRRLACCIPIRGGGSGERRSDHPVECLLVSSRRCALRRPDAGTPPSSNLVFPKGGWEANETLVEAAEREAFEEAGVRGRLETPHVDVFEYESLKHPEERREKNSGTQYTYSRHRTVYVFVLHVTTEHEEWPEQESRSRVWVPVHEVRGKLKHAWMQVVFDRLCTERGWDQRDGPDHLK